MDILFTIHMSNMLGSEVKTQKIIHSPRYELAKMFFANLKRGSGHEVSREAEVFVVVK